LALFIEKLDFLVGVGSGKRSRGLLLVKCIGGLLEMDSETFWKRRMDAFLESGEGIQIGDRLDIFGRAFLDLKALDTHLHVIGRTGVGKTYFLELLARNLIHEGYGFCVIDPHGGLYKRIAQYLATQPHRSKDVLFFNPSEEGADYSIGFNPLKRWKYYPQVDVQVRLGSSGIAKIWQDDPKRTPLLQRNISNILYPLIEGGLTYIESGYFTDLTRTEPRKYLASLTRNERVRREWDIFERFSLPRKKDELGSLINRLPAFVDNHSVRATLGRTRHVLDVEDIIEGRKILLCNLSRGGRQLMKEDSNLLGLLLLNELASYALSRDEDVAKRKPFFVIIDEFQNYVSPDIPDILDECRKFGLHLILSHQRLAHLQKEDRDVYSAVMSNARSKVIFSVSEEDAEILEKEVFAGEHELSEIKQELHRTTVLEYREEEREILSEGEGEGGSLGWGHGDGEGAGQMFDPGQGFLSSPDLKHVTTHSSTIDTRSEVQHQSRFTSKSKVPMLIPVLGKELASVQFYSLEEQRYKKTAAIKKQDVRHCFVKVLENPTQKVRIDIVPSVEASAGQIRTVFRNSWRKQSRYYCSADKVLSECEERAQEIEKRADEMSEKEGGESDTPESFYE